MEILSIRTGWLWNATQQFASGIELQYATVTVAIGYEELQEESRGVIQRRFNIDNSNKD